MTDIGKKELKEVAEKAIAQGLTAKSEKANLRRLLMKLQKQISRYALSDTQETIAEAFADVYCNGEKAQAFSGEIVGETMNLLEKIKKEYDIIKQKGG